ARTIPARPASPRSGQSGASRCRATRWPWLVKALLMCRTVQPACVVAPDTALWFRPRSIMVAPAKRVGGVLAPRGGPLRRAHARLADGPRGHAPHARTGD